MLVQRRTTEQLVTESYIITGVTAADMQKMTQVHDRVMNIIRNHLNKEAEKKEYLNDDDLYDIVAILHAFTKDHRTIIKKSCFDECKEKLIELCKKIANPSEPQPQWEEDEDEERSAIPFKS